MEVQIVAAATFATVFVIMLMVCSVVVDRQHQRSAAELDAAQAMYEGQQAAI